jgi:hypothetical protein
VGLRFHCDACGGLGYRTYDQVAGPPFREARLLEWPWRCPTCGGRGHLRQGELARKLGIDRDTVERLAELRARPSTAARVFGKLLELAGLVA